VPGADRMTIEEVVRKVLLDEHADVIREAVRAVAAELMELEDRRVQCEVADQMAGGREAMEVPVVPGRGRTPGSAVRGAGARGRRGSAQRTPSSRADQRMCPAGQRWRAARP
jgi:hypothetical protein